MSKEDLTIAGGAIGTGDLRFPDEREAFENELEAYYGAPPLDIVAWERELHAQSRAHPDWSPFRRKILGYEFMAERCPVHVFRHCPFFFEINTGRPRTDLGTGGLGGWLKREPFGEALTASSGQWWAPCRESGLSFGWTVLDDNHHTVSYGKVLRLGLRGIIREIEGEADRAETEEERDFLAAAIAGNRALIRIAERFAGDAERQIAGEEDPAVRRRLALAAATARRVPAEPAATFHEALNAILFLFYVLPSVEGNGISVFGHVDRLLFPFYQADREAGRLTPDEARDAVSFFLAISDARYGMRRAAPGHVGTNGTVTLGGCDREGAPVFNAVTRLFLEQHRDLRLIDPKVNARVSARHQEAYVSLLSDFTAAGGNSLALFNDDVVIPANVRMGKAPEDARLYVGGGCQENVLEECEVNSRATLYLNLLHVFLMGFFPEKGAFFFGRAGLELARYDGCSTYDELHGAFLANLAAVVGAHVDERNRTEREGVRFNPCPLHSSMLDDCVAARKDMMAGGCRYNFGSVSLTGIGTLIDSLYAVKVAVYGERAVPLDRLHRLLETDFAGEEAFRAWLVKHVPKFGQEDEGIRAFSARVFEDVARAASGMPNSRGGCYEASLFSFRSFMSFGAATGATPDGRRAGEPLSAGMSPGLLAFDRGASVGQVLSALEPLDLTLYPVVAVLDVKLPAVRGGLPARVIAPVIRRFLQAGGSVLQVNCVDPAMLREARVHPERHPDLVVRVSGYSSLFVRLAGPIQDEIIARTEINACSE
jgi:formate C-acetyltransferase